MTRTTRATTVRSVVEAAAGVFGLDGRRAPGRRAVFDWLVVAPGGVFVIDEHPQEADAGVTVRATHDRDAEESGGWHLLVDGTERPQVLSGVQSRARAVRDVLDAAGIVSWGVVVPVVCFQGASLPRLRRHVTAGRTHVVGPRGLADLLRRGGILDERELARIRDLFDDAFPGGFALA
jgi:hypothetical protein